MKTEVKDPKLQELQEKLEAKKAGRLPLNFDQEIVIWLNPRPGKIKRFLRFDWLLKRARSGFPALVPLEKVLFLAIQ